MGNCKDCGGVVKDSERARTLHRAKCPRKKKFKVNTTVAPTLVHPPAGESIAAVATPSTSVPHDIQPNPQAQPVENHQVPYSSDITSHPYPSELPPVSDPINDAPMIDPPSPDILTSTPHGRQPAPVQDSLPVYEATASATTALHTMAEPEPTSSSTLASVGSTDIDPLPQLEQVTFPSRDTTPNIFGIFRRYFCKDPPTRESGEAAALDYGYDAPTFENVQRARNEAAAAAQSTPETASGSASQTPNDAEPAKKDPPFFPLSNMSTFLLIDWWYKTPQKSINDFQNLIDNVLLSDDFRLSDIKDLKARRELKRLDLHTSAKASQSHHALPISAGASTPSETPNPDSLFTSEKGWKKSSVILKLPCPKRKYSCEDDAPEVEVPGIYHRSLVEGITQFFQGQSFFDFHLKGYQQWWKPSETEPLQRIYGEVYTSNAFLEMEQEIQQRPLPLQEEDKRNGIQEAIVAPIMLYSDSTQLANFGSASLWPIYMYLGALSQYVRSKASAFTAFHLAYIISLPAFIEEAYRQVHKVAPSDDMMTHLKRDMMQAIWMLLLTPDFIEAYVHGLVIICADKIKRRIFPRFFTYSADYPEKVLLLCIRYLSKCLCGECLTEMTDVPDLGTDQDILNRMNVRFDNKDVHKLVDKARKRIFKEGRAVWGSSVKKFLDIFSLTAARNAFSRTFLDHGFNIYKLFPVDILHEFEIGVWKQTFLHLVRVLYAAGDSFVVELDSRYRKIPTFGASAIRKFSQKVSALKQPAARDFEDLLICAIPCFEDLLPEPFNSTVLDLLFLMAVWHGFAKMRLHSDSSLEAFRGITTDLGSILRKFKSTVCEEYEMQETPEEKERRDRRHAQKVKKAQKAGVLIPENADTRRRRTTKKEYNLETYKVHALGHYADTIARLGSTLSYSTQTGESEHRRIKKLYIRTNKRDHAEQIACHVAREENLARIRSKVQHLRRSRGILEKEPLPPSNPDARYQMASSTHNSVELPFWLREHEGDYAIHDFMPKLKDHLYRRLTRTTNIEEELTDAQRNNVQILRDMAYFHQLLCINYTTYDMRRDQDVINVRTHSDVFVLRSDSDDENNNFPFWFCRVIGILHLNARLLQGDSGYPTLFERIDVLWVRWFGLDGKWKHGFSVKRLPRLGFGHSADATTFGFLDPAHVLRAAHLMPAFSLGTTDRFLPRGSLGRRPDEPEDYMRYYVDIFADRDMLSIFAGTGIGHKSIRSRLKTFQEDLKRAFVSRERAPRKRAPAAPTDRVTRSAKTQRQAEEEDPSSEEETPLRAVPKTVIPPELLESSDSESSEHEDDDMEQLSPNESGRDSDIEFTGTESEDEQRDGEASDMEDMYIDAV